ncbi:hypothetical protein CASFOL_008740 [Castilleja foliolosa]|uniref:GTD-binding domain-containing protein n=1 Tax=Castilleja foliolosa TaxID=1961234 RepID=A0ABD3E0D3_9LAMI
MAVDKKRRIGFMNLLSSAASEWFLILLLFAHASLSYLLTKFANYFELETPCLLCSNAFGQNKRGFYWNLLCTHHREEISCLVSCSFHGKFADVQTMCDECLAPIIDRSKSSSDSYRLLVGKSWLDVDRSVLQNLVLNKHIRLGFPDHRTCSCCGKTWRAKSGTERLIEFNTVGLEASKANMKPPLPRTPGNSRFRRRDSLKRLRDKLTGQMPSLSSSESVDTLSHVGYTKLKISSDTESEFPFSEEEDDCRSTSSRVKSCEHKRSIPNVIDLSGEEKNGMSSPTDIFKNISLEDFEWPVSPCLSQDLNVPGGFFGGSAESSKSNVILPHMQALSVLSEFLSMCNIPPSPDASATPKKSNVFGTSENRDNASEAGNTEAFVGTSSDDAHSLESTNTHQINPPNDQTDETGEIEPTNPSDSAKTEEDIRPIKETIPQTHKPRNELDDSSSSKQLPVPALPKKPEPNYESSDGTALTDPEGENIIDSLKRQAENDRSLLNNLYKDLEEERNASAIAANQAMAMITRLQEEKAALHMEALQYLRMMEEQAEYDMEALGRANDLLTDKEKELQDLEIELEFYRNNFLDESGVHNLQSETSVVVNRVPNLTPKENGFCEPMNSSLANFEEEKAYIVQCLKKLEIKLLQAYSGGKFDDLPNGLRSEKINGTLLIQENEENVIPLSNGYHDFAHEKSEKISANQGAINFAKFEKEIKEIYERLEAIETDRDFIKRTCDFLRSGKDGLELVKEIAQHLHELRKMEFVKR